MSQPKYVVGIGASAGGLEALQELFEHIPDHSNMAFVIIQHLSPDFESLMGDLLRKYTNLKINTPEKPAEVLQNNIYLIPTNKNLIYKDGKLIPVAKDPKLKLNLPIDIFLQSLGEQAREKSIGIVLSGTGTDGSRGIKSIKENGGLVIVQTPETAKFDGMPRASIKVGIADSIDSPKGIGKTLSKLQTESFEHIAQSFDQQTFSSNESFQQIINLLKKKMQVDFSRYRPETLIRRTRNRMQITSSKSLEQYYERISNNSEELHRLYQDFLIGVTKFFRDHEAWESIKEEVIPKLIEKGESSGMVRVWSVATSTGEEAYTMAILLEEAIKKSKKNITYKIFATDASRSAIDFASKGIYNDNIGGDIDANYLHEYFSKRDYTYTINKNIRQKIVFSQHDALQDPPIIGVDLVICRNFLIYLKPAVQKNLMSVFQFSLAFKGHLFLGISENVGDLSNVFTPINKNYKVFQNVLKEKILPQTRYKHHYDEPYELATSNNSEKDFLGKKQEQFFIKNLLKKSTSPSLFVTPDLNILYSHGDLDNYLTLPRGMVGSLNLVDMLDKKASLIVRNGVRTCNKENKELYFDEVPLTLKDDSKKNIGMQFSPLWLDERQMKIVLIQLYESDETTSIGKSKEPLANIDHIELLENEIKELKYELQKTKEELEASNEELQASNEELLGANEELQSSNEELQSVNEELYAVNNEFQVKITELSELNDDINVLFQNLDNAVIYLDKNLYIRKLTPKVEDIFNFSQNDIGRPISHFSHWLEDFGLVQKVSKVIQSPQYIEGKVNHPDGETYWIRIIPYKTSKDMIDGAVISLNNITEVAKAHQRIELQDEMLQTAGKLAKMLVWELDPNKNELTFTTPPKGITTLPLNSEQIKIETFGDLFDSQSKELLKEGFKNLIEKNKELELNLESNENDSFFIKASITELEAGNKSGFGFIQQIG